MQTPPLRAAPGPRPSAHRLADAVSRPFRLLAAVVLALLLLSGLTSVAQLGVFTPRLQQAWQTVAELHRAEQAMVDQETGVRGFLLAPPTIDRQFLEPYTRGSSDYETAVRQLQSLVRTGDLADALAQREQAAQTWQTQWARAAVGDAAGKPTSAAFLTQGMALFDEYRRADSAAAALLDARVSKLLRWQRAVAAGGGGLGLIIVLAALAAVRRTRRQLLQSVATPLAAVAAAVRIGTDGGLPPAALGHSEITELDELAEDVTALFRALSRRDTELRAHARELDVLGAASRALLTDPDPRNAICRAATQITGATRASLFEPDTATTLIDTASLGSPPGQVVLALDGTPNLTALVFTSRKAVVVEDIHTDPRVARAVADGLPATGGIWLPVLSDTRCLGVLVVALPDAASQLRPSMHASLAVLAAAAAAAIDRVDLHDRLAQQARTDGLTGVANRRTWDEQLPVELARAARSGQPLAVAMLDLDHFKAYNDTHGHQAGDRLLRAAAHRWHDRLRSTDLLARYGGEEFAVALPDCDLPAAVALLDTLREQVPDGQTCSVGVALWDRVESGLDLLARADQALYRAKDDGRNRVTTAHPAPGNNLAGHITPSAP